MPDLPVLDTAPQSGVFVEHYELELTEEEIKKGNTEGAVLLDIAEYLGIDPAAIVSVDLTLDDNV